MRPFLIVTLFCVPMLFVVASAQELTPEQLQQQFEQELRRLQSPRAQLQLEANYLARYDRQWAGIGTTEFLSNYVFMPGRIPSSELGLTEEQMVRLSFLDRNRRGEWLRQQDWQNVPEVAQATAAFNATRLPDDPMFDHATEEQKNSYREGMVAEMSSYSAVMQRELQETLTLEQMFLVRTWEMQSMVEIGIPHPAMFEILDLTDDQKEEMSRIAKEVKVEFDRFVIEHAAFHFEREASGYKLLEGKSYVSREEFDNALREVRAPIWGEEMGRNLTLQREQGVELLTRMQNRMMNVLTDEQLGRMQEILDETPEFIRRLLAHRRAQREAAQLSPTYVPGPDSWRPGDPMPMQIREERQRSRFPRGE